MGTTPTVTNNFTAGTKAKASEVNANFTDLINAITDGTKTNEAAAWRGANGSLAEPAFAFLNDTDTGFILDGTGAAGVVAAGAQIARFDSSGLLLGTNLTSTSAFLHIKSTANATAIVEAITTTSSALMQFTRGAATNHVIGVDASSGAFRIVGGTTSAGGDSGYFLTASNIHGFGIASPSSDAVAHFYRSGVTDTGLIIESLTNGSSFIRYSEDTNHFTTYYDGASSAFRMHASTALTGSLGLTIDSSNQVGINFSGAMTAPLNVRATTTGAIFVDHNSYTSVVIGSGQTTVAATVTSRGFLKLYNENTMMANLFANPNDNAAKFGGKIAIGRGAEGLSTARYFTVYSNDTATGNDLNIIFQAVNTGSEVVMQGASDTSQIFQMIGGTDSFTFKLNSAGNKLEGLGLSSTTAFDINLTSGAMTMGDNLYVPSGNVAIGSLTANAPLHVYGTASEPTSTSGGGSIFMVEGNASDSALHFGSRTGSPWANWIQSQQVNGTIAPMILNPRGGNIGIGTVSPGQSLDVRKDQAATTAIVVRNDNNSTSSVVALHLQCGAGADTAGYISLERQSTATGDCDLLFKLGNAAQERMRIDSSGNVGIGTASPGGSRLLIAGSSDTSTSSILDVNDNGTLGRIFDVLGNGEISIRTSNWGTGGTAIGYDTGDDRLTTSPSSLRYKENVQDLSLEIDTTQIYKLRPVTFDYKVDNNHSLGYIAEEVYDCVPSIVHTRSLKEDEDSSVANSDGLVVESVRYDLLTVFLVEEVKKLRDEVTDLKKQIEANHPA